MFLSSASAKKSKYWDLTCKTNTLANGKTPALLHRHQIQDVQPEAAQPWSEQALDLTALHVPELNERGTSLGTAKRA